LVIQSNLAIRNFLVALKLFLNAKCSLSLWSKWQIGHGKWFLNTNKFLIKPFLIAKFDCRMLIENKNNGMYSLFQTGMYDWIGLNKHSIQIGYCTINPTIFKYNTRMEWQYDRPALWWSNVYSDRLGIIRWDIAQWCVLSVFFLMDLLLP
jgi:hypothetical protein